MAGALRVLTVACTALVAAARRGTAGAPSATGCKTRCGIGTTNRSTVARAKGVLAVGCAAPVKARTSALAVTTGGAAEENCGTRLGPRLTRSKGHTA